MTSVISRKILGFCLVGLFLAVTSTSSGQTVDQRPRQAVSENERPPSPDRGRITSRPFAHPMTPSAVDPRRMPPQPPQMRARNQRSEPAAAYWKRLIRLIRKNAKLEAAVEKAEAIARIELRAVQAIADVELRAAEEKRAIAEELNDELRARIERLEQEINQAEQEMRERSIHAEHMERQMMQRTRLVEELEQQLRQARSGQESPLEEEQTE